MFPNRMEMRHNLWEVYMVYATPYNFMGRVLYEGLDEAYLVPEAIEKLKKANELLIQKK